MARILQVSCDNPFCYNMIELADSEDWDYVNGILTLDFGWGLVDGEELCPDCLNEDDKEDNYSE